MKESNEIIRQQVFKTSKAVVVVVVVVVDSIQLMLSGDGNMESTLTLCCAVFALSLLIVFIILLE